MPVQSRTVEEQAILMDENAAPSSIAFASAKEALAHLESLSGAAAQRLLYRGERNKYPTSLPSAYRLSQEEQALVGVLVANLASHFWSDILWPSVEFRTEGLYFGGELLGDLHAIEQVRSAPSYIDVQQQFEPLFQHYGWPTTWLDVTYEPRVAIFFASFDFSRNRFTSNGTGYIYYWEQSDLRQALHFIDIVDLKYLAGLLSHALHVEGSRPSRQSGASIRVGLPMGAALQDHDKLIASARRCVTFDRHDVEEVSCGHDYYFPRDELKEMLEAHQRKYLRWAERYNQEAHPDNRMEFVDIGQRLMRRVEDEQRSHWQSCGYNYRLIERYYDCAFDLAYQRQIISAASKFLSQGRVPAGLEYEQFDQILRTLTGERRFNA